MLLGLDLGTSSVKALLMDEDGAILGKDSASYAVRAPRPGWAESYPQDWWEAVVEATASAVGRRGADVTALGLSGQMHGVVLVDELGLPLRPAVIWADARSGAELEAYRRLDEDLCRRLANPPAVGMAGPSLLWLRDQEPDAYMSARWALQPKDWLRMRMTGEAATEPSDASATLLYNLPADDWSYAVVEDLGLGTGLLRPGPVQLTIGTGGQVVTPKGAPERDPQVRTHLYRAALPGLWYSMAAIQNAGLALEWVRRVLGVSWKDVYEGAFAVPPGSGGVTF